MADLPIVRSLLGLVFTGERLRATRNRPEPESPFPGVLDPEPHLRVLFGQPKTGKTSLALWIVVRWALGFAPWDGAPTLPGSGVFIISREQPLVRIDSLLRRFGRSESWESSVFIVGRDPELATPLRPLLTLDSKGLSLLRQVLDEAKAAGDPIGLVVLDSLSRLKPSGVEENDNDRMSEWLDWLEEIAVEFNVYVLLIHHKGHARDGSRSDAKSAGRGASAIGAVALGLLLLERVKGKPRHRRLKVEGGYVLKDEIELEVASEDDHPEKILYFKPTDSLAEYDPRNYIAPGEGISTNELAWRLAKQPKKPGKNPPGAATKLAGRLRDRWVSEGRIEVEDGGPGQSKLIRLKPDLATSPEPRQQSEANLGEPHLATAPIEARGGGEVEGDSRPEEGDEGGRGSEAGQPPQRVCSKTSDPGRTWRRKAHESGNRSA
jgi:hypothetical protein